MIKKSQLSKTSTFVISRSIRSYCESPRESWVMKWPGQAILCISQTYWTANIHQVIKNGLEDEKMITSVINSSLTHSYEYLGNTVWLVTTPLTDCCYRTLFGALHLHLGGAPEGPARHWED
ncbi:dynein axonemal heavy chain 12-like isoform X3 [Tachypleus tridentatus]|uniref:dynein axonemal heavy chain 12-like isoform X3 n=1 Tax=Tachypleus tridentatus TaxID=6853 RepID=UPI003FD4A7B2